MKNCALLHRKIILCCVFLCAITRVYAQDQKTFYKTLETLNDSLFIVTIEQQNDTEERQAVINFNERIRKIIERNRNHSNSQTVVKARFLYYTYLITLKDYRHALTVLNDILRGNTPVSRADSIRLYSHISRVYAELGVFSRAYDFQEHMEEMAGSANLHKNLSLFTKSMLFSKFKMHKKALEQLKKEFETIPASERTPLSKTSFHNNLGFHWTKLGNADSAIAHFNMALTNAKTIDSVSNPKLATFFIGLIKGNIGQALMLQKKYAEAIPLLKEDISLSKKVAEHENAALSQYELARCYLEMGEHSLALKNIDSALLVVTKKSNCSSYILLKEFKGEIFYRTGEIKNYSTILREMQLLEDSLRKVNDYGSVVNNETLLGVFNFEKEVRKKEQDFKKRARQAEADKIWRNYVRIILIALSVIILILVINAVTNHKKRKALTENNKKINEQNQIIEESLREKDMLIREIHHRVKNNLQMVSSLLNLQSNRVSDDAARTALRESMSRIDSMAIIHQQLYGKSDFRTIRIDTYLKQLLFQIERGYSQGNKKVLINIDAPPVTYSLDVAIPMGIIMNEVITNCYKHAFNRKISGIIEVHLVQQEGKNLLTISDDGDGLPQDFDTRKKHSLGQELIVLLVEQIGGALEISSNKGTQYKIVF